MAQAHVSILATFNEDRQAQNTLTPGRYTTDWAQGRREDRAALRGQWEMTIHAQDQPTIYSLRTVDGGALSWYALREQLTFDVAVDGAQQLGFGNIADWKAPLIFNSWSYEDLRTRPVPARQPSIRGGVPNRDEGTD
ncbi:hypothetical protein [Streptosporangium sp. NPDC051022]|uniref:hypothetical protein n=1 Tax=Streptosporangium sp. NPDC051022 TaxID=3155752 RepID=UPI003445633B